MSSSNLPRYSLVWSNLSILCLSTLFWSIVVVSCVKNSKGQLNILCGNACKYLSAGFRNSSWITCWQIGRSKPRLGASRINDNLGKCQAALCPVNKLVVDGRSDSTQRVGALEGQRRKQHVSLLNFYHKLLWLYEYNNSGLTCSQTYQGLPCNEGLNTGTDALGTDAPRSVHTNTGTWLNVCGNAVK